MTVHSARKASQDLPVAFHDSILGLYLDGHATAVFAKGRLQTLAEAEALNSRSGALHVLLHGRLTGAHDWFGPGNHFDQADAARAGGLIANGGPAMLWTLDNVGDLLGVAEGDALAQALTRAEAAEAAASPPASHPDSARLCDHDHPAIRRQAVRLRRASPASTAKAIFHFVQSMPYRFGHWHECASTTLARGVGMCTTKANLQVALMRAAGLEAGFVETPMPMSRLGKLMPDAWLALMRNEVRHYFAAVRLNGTWWACDASYDDAAFNIYIETMPELAFLIPAFFDEGRPYSPAYAAKGIDPTDITVMPDLQGVMGKTSRFGARHFEALNTKADRARGWHRRDLPAATDLRGEAAG